MLEFLRKQRDLYKYIHDQSVRLLNAGFTPLEIADRIELPESLRMPFANRDYYGTVRHNARAVYQATAVVGVVGRHPDSYACFHLSGGARVQVNHCRARLPTSLRLFANFIRRQGKVRRLLSSGLGADDGRGDSGQRCT